MTQEEAAKLPLGLYRLFLTNGMTVAAIGRNDEGRRWYAPTNWLDVPSYDWRNVERVELITTLGRERKLMGLTKEPNK